MIKFFVNEQEVSYSPQENDSLSLLDYLRDELRLTGTKRGCEEKVCHACSVLIDGKAERSCHVLAKDMEGKHITTIEGLGTEEELHPIQQAFIEYNAIQCGFCTPGIIMRAKSLLSTNPNPTEAEIKKGLNLHLCRCGTYPRVLKAVNKAAAVMRGESPAPYVPADFSQEGSFIGKSIPRLDLPEKVTGKTKFFADYHFDNSMYGRAVFSPHPHANILSIDTKPAYDIPGVVLVITAEDVPGHNYYGVLSMDQPVLCDKKVKHIGDVVAVVFAETDKIAEEAAKAVAVEYEVLPGIFSVEDALKEDAPLLPNPELKPHPMAYIAGEKGNICKEVHVYRGDTEKDLNECDVVVDEFFATQIEEHAWIETDGSIARIDEDGMIAVYAPNQSPFADRAQLAYVLGLAPEEVRVVHTPAGGAFGGKTELTTHAFTAIATLKTGRPSRMVYTRKDSLRTHPKRHPYNMQYKLGARKDGKITTMQIHLESDVGAYVSWTPRVLEQAISYSTGPYYVPNLDLTALGVYTNNMVKGAMRGFGAIQTHFASEVAMNMMAEKLNMDPIDLREINGLETGLPMTTGQIVTSHLGIDYKNTLKKAREIINEKLQPWVNEEREKGRILGIGVASGWRSVAGGLGPAENAGATFILNKDGKVDYYIACTEMGQGSHTSLEQIAAEVTGVAMKDMHLVAGDTDIVPYGGGVMASRGVFLWGHATIEAGKKFKESLLAQIAQAVNKSVDELDIRESQVLDKDGNCIMTLAEFAKENHVEFKVEVDFHLPKSVPVAANTNEDKAIPDDKYNVHHTVAYNTSIAVVEVNPDTGAVTVPYMGAVVDGGRIINPDAAMTQIEGALIMGAGYGLTHDFQIKDGHNVTNSLGKTKIPRFADFPNELEVVFTPANDPTGPFGAKGIAEVAGLTPAPAIANAIHDATGYWVTELPVSKHKDAIAQAIKDKQ